MNSFIAGWRTISVKLGGGFKDGLSLSQFGAFIKCDYRIFVQTSWNHQLFLLFGGNVWHIEWEKNQHLHLRRDFTLVNSDGKLSRSRIISSRINRSDNFPPIFLARKLWIVWGTVFLPEPCCIKPFGFWKTACWKTLGVVFFRVIGDLGMFYPMKLLTDSWSWNKSKVSNWIFWAFLLAILWASHPPQRTQKDTKGLWIAHRCAAATDKLRSVRTIRELINKKGWKLPLDLFLFRRRVGFFYGLSFWMYIPHHLVFFALEISKHQRFTSLSSFYGWYTYPPPNVYTTSEIKV